MHDEILRAIGSAVPLLLLAWYAYTESATRSALG